MGARICLVIGNFDFGYFFQKRVSCKFEEPYDNLDLGLLWEGRLLAPRIGRVMRFFDFGYLFSNTRFVKFSKNPMTIWIWPPSGTASWRALLTAAS